MSEPSYLAGFDSASTMVVATSRALHGEQFPALGNPPFLRPAARATRWLPQNLRNRAFVLFGALETFSPRRVGGIDLEEASEWVTGSYPERTYPMATVGSSSGALVYLHAALGIPWLPQTFLIPLRQRVHPDDPVAAMHKGSGPGRRFLRDHPEVQLHHMHDAVQDRRMVRVLTYFRYKRRTLGRAYEAFLADRLAPGGTVLLSECTASWRTTSVGDRHVFQHGALGGATEDEFHHGGPRVAEYLERHDSPVRAWPEPTPDTVSPEAEWGFAPALREDVARFASEHGMRVRRLVFDHPDALSPVVADLYRWWYERRGIPARRLFVGSFAISEPWWVLRTGSVPFWMFFNEENSLDRLTRWLDEREPFEDIVLSLFQNGVETVGQPGPGAWREVLARARREGRYAGTDLDDFPHDFGQFGRYDQALEEMPARYPVPAPMAPAELEEFLRQAGDYEGVSWEPLELR